MWRLRRAVKTTVERELKLQADGSLSIDDLGGEPVEPRTFTSTYHDTGDGILLRLGIQLRHRLEDGANIWQLKLPREDGPFGLEVDGVPGDPPSELAEVLRAALDGRHLRPVATLRTAQWSTRRRRGGHAGLGRGARRPARRVAVYRDRGRADSVAPSIEPGAAGSSSKLTDSLQCVRAIYRCRSPLRQTTRAST